MADGAAWVDRLSGLLLGTALGDSIGLPYEGMGRVQVARVLPDAAGLRHFLGIGLASDDTEHAILAARALLASKGDPVRFRAALVSGLRIWFATVPPGIGLATLKACSLLCLRFPPEESGRFSAGNGPLMRSPVIGAVIPDRVRRDRLVAWSTEITHTDPKAAIAAMAMADLAALAVKTPVGQRPAFAEVVGALRRQGATDDDWDRYVKGFVAAAKAQMTTNEFAASVGMGAGATGFAYHSAIAAAYAWWACFGDFRATIHASVAYGGDTDSVAATAGALAGASLGEAGLPVDWLASFCDRPCSAAALRAHARALAGGPVPSYPWWQAPPRNVIFLVIALAAAFITRGRSFARFLGELRRRPT